MQKSANGGKGDWTSMKAIPLSKGTASKQNELLRTDYFWSFMETFEPMGNQIIDRAGDMKLNSLHSTMLGPGGGVMFNLLYYVFHN